MGDVQRRILLVDDEPAVLKMVGKRLQVAGFKVIVSMDGKDALLKVQDESPDLIILDWMLPQLSGLDVCKKLKHDERYRQVPIILFTAKDSEEDYWRGMGCGADAYLTKPFKARELEQLVTRMVKALQGDRSSTTTDDDATV